MKANKPSHRIAKLNDQFRQAIASYMIHGLRNPGAGFVTITRVKVSPDITQARVFYTVFGSPEEVEDTKRVLKDSAKEVRHHLAYELNLRHTPQLIFQYDDDLEEAYKMDRLFYELERH